MWHMPHGIILLTSHKNNNCCYLLFEQPASHHFHATPCVSSYLCFPSHNFLASTKSTRSTSHQDQKGLTPLLALLLDSIRDAFLKTYALLPNHLSEDSHHEYLKLSHTHQIILNFEDFYCRNGVQLRISLGQLAYLTKGASTRPRVPYYSPQQRRTGNISSASSYCRSSSPSHDLRSVTRPTPHKIVLGNLTTCQQLASRSAPPNNVMQHLALLLS